MYTSSGAAVVRHGSVVTRHRRRVHAPHRATGCQHASGQSPWSFAYLGSTARPNPEHPGDRLGYLAIESDSQLASRRCTPTKYTPSLAIVIRCVCARRILRGLETGASTSVVDRHPLPRGIKEPAGLRGISLAPCNPMPLGTDSIMLTLHDRSRVGSGPAGNPNTATGLAVPSFILAYQCRPPRAELCCPWPSALSRRGALVVDEARIQHV